MTGTQAEQALLGSLLLSTRFYGDVTGEVSADDFTDQRLGAIFAGMGRMIASGIPVNEISVANNFGQWKIRNVDPSELHAWTALVPGSYRAVEFAQSVRESAVRRALRDISSRYLEASSDTGRVAGDVVSLAIEELTRLQQRSASSSFVARKLAEILGEVDEYDWIIPGLLERRDRLIITGHEGIGKTTFVRQMAILCSAGVHPFTGARIKPVKVLVVDAENTERQWRRAVPSMVAAAAMRGQKDPAEAVHIMAGNRIDITRDAHLAQIHRLVDEHRPDVLFIGPLYKMVPRAITNDDDATPLIVALDSLRERDIALVMEAHAGKGNGDGGERDLRPRGSAALLGWPEFGFGLQPHPEDDDMVQVKRWRGDRESRQWPKLMRRGAEGEFPWVEVPNFQERAA